MWRVTPPGYVHEYGESSAIRMSITVSRDEVDQQGNQPTMTPMQLAHSPPMADSGRPHARSPARAARLAIIER